MVCPIRHWSEGFNSWRFSSFLEEIPRSSKLHNIQMTDFNLVPVCLPEGSILTIRSAASSPLSERDDLYWNLHGFFLSAAHHFPLLFHHHQSSFLVTWIKLSLFTFPSQYSSQPFILVKVVHHSLYLPLFLQITSQWFSAYLEYRYLLLHYFGLKDSGLPHPQHPTENR